MVEAPHQQHRCGDPARKDCRTEPGGSAPPDDRPVDEATTSHDIQSRTPNPRCDLRANKGQHRGPELGSSHKTHKGSHSGRLGELAQPCSR